MRTILFLIVRLYTRVALELKELRLRYKMRPGNYERAVRKADRLHRRTSKRYRVFFILGRYRVWTRDDIKRQKKAEVLKRDLKAGKDFDRIAYYDTNRPDHLTPKIL